MDQTDTPPNDLWTLLINGSPLNIVTQVWADANTLTLTATGTPDQPVTVTLEYTGPDNGLRVLTGSKVQAFGPITIIECVP